MEQQPKRGDGCDHNYENFSSKFSQPEDGGICCATFICRRCGDFQVKKRIPDKLGIPVEDLIIKDI